MALRAVLVSATLALVVVACGGQSRSTSVGSPSTVKSTGADGASVRTDATKPCTVLSPADFTTVGVTVDNSGEDVSSNFTITTSTSAACQWTNFAGAGGGSWELVIGTGDAQSAYSNAAPFGGTPGVSQLSLGDESYFVDKVSQLNSSDHDFEAGVRKGDVVFKLSTTDDMGGPAIQALAAIVIRRLG